MYVGDWRRSHECQDTPFVTVILFVSQIGVATSFIIAFLKTVCAAGPFRVDSDIDHLELFQPVVECTAGSGKYVENRTNVGPSCSARSVMSSRSGRAID